LESAELQADPRTDRLQASADGIVPQVARTAPSSSTGISLARRIRLSKEFAVKMRPLLRSSMAVVGILGCACAASFGTYPQAVLDSGPAAYWRFESVNDTSLVNGFTSSYQGDATVTGAAGGVPLAGVPANRALSLDGTGDFVSTSLDAEYTFADTYTFLGWIKLSALPSAQNRFMVIADKSTLGNDLGIQFITDDSLHFYTDAGTSTAFMPPSGTLVGSWHFVGATYDDVNNFRRLYWDGQLVADDVLAPDHGPDAIEFRIGDSLTFPNRFFQGLIDEVAVYDRALSSAEIANLYLMASVPEPSTVLLVSLGLCVAPLWRRRRAAIRSSTSIPAEFLPREE
jgi:hypothetical protein